MSIIDIGSLFGGFIWNSLPETALIFIIYSYLLYTLFFKNSKFAEIKNLEEAGSLILIFLNLYILIIPLILGIYYLSYIIYDNILPSTLTFSITDSIIAIIMFTFFPYQIKKSMERKKKKFSLGDWLLLINIIYSGVFIFSLINIIYTSNISTKINSQFMGTSIILAIIFIINLGYLHVLSINLKQMKINKLNILNIIYIIIFQILSSIIFCFLHWNLKII
ncbi:MAG: hypothetical protein WC376_02665 [Candidatus Nanoarchaeia archaeon]|jgi:hypothetical protein